MRKPTRYGWFLIFLYLGIIGALILMWLKWRP